MKKILIVEDDPFLLDIYKTRLEKEGFEVTTAQNGEQAFEALKKESFDLLLLDLVLPELNGFELLERIKKEKKFEKLKIVVISNLGQKEDIEKAKTLGVEKYLVKAFFTPTEIVSEIKSILK